MKKYVKPEAEYINFYSEEEITTDNGASLIFGEGGSYDESDHWE